MEGTITALKAQKRDKNRVSVYLDGEYAFGLTRIVAAWLSVGQVLSAEKIAELRGQDSREKAHQQALRLLNYRDRSESEVRQRLGQKQVPEEIITEVVERLHRSGLIDDKRFAQTWIDNRAEFHPRSRRALAYELRGKGIDPQAIQDALDPFDEDEAAYAAARKYAQKLKQMEWPVFRQKMIGFLARRGFAYETANTALTRVWAERNGENASKDTPISEEVDL